MKILIAKMKDNTMVTNIDLRDIKDKGEISHCICELERAKAKLLVKWDEMLT